MLKSELIARLANKIPQLPVKTIHDGVNHLLQQMSDALTTHQRIEIRGFGSFAVKHHLAREAHNPKTGETITAMEKFKPHFKPGKALREHINAAQATTPIQNDLDPVDNPRQ